VELATVLGDGLNKGKFWTDAWSLVEGCTPVSPGCANCWLAGMENRFHGQTRGNDQGDKRILTKEGKFSGLVFSREDRLSFPLKKRNPRVYAIWSDLFHGEVSDIFQDQAIAVMGAAQRHHFIIVTKRPEVAVAYFESREFRKKDGANWPNVTILVTMEDQQRADERAPYAMQLAAQGWRVGALCEPLLGPVDLTRIYQHGTTEGGGSWGSWESALNGKTPDIWGGGPDIEGGPRLSWVITGGESGASARPVHPDWVRSLRDQAQAAGIPFMFKQWGEWAPYDGGPEVDDDPEQTKFLTMEWREDQWEDVGYPGWSDFADYVDSNHCTARVGKRKAGRSLDGREWLELPAT